MEKVSRGRGRLGLAVGTFYASRSMLGLFLKYSWRRNLVYREVKGHLNHGHTANKWWASDLNPDISEATVLFLFTVAFEGFVISPSAAASFAQTSHLFGLSSGPQYTKLIVSIHSQLLNTPHCIILPAQVSWILE